MSLIMKEDLFEDQRTNLRLCEGAMWLPGFAKSREAFLHTALQSIVKQAPFRNMFTPGGFRMSVAMTNCGKLGWVTDLAGYRYEEKDPESGLFWPPMPPIFLEMAQAAALKAGFPAFFPDACLINCYEPGAKMSLHQDKNERDLSAPIVSITLGLPATFLFGGLNRADPVQRLFLIHSDVVVWGGPARLFYHGIIPLKKGYHPFWGSARINLTFRKVA
ncbi:Alpha-ketoglutarate-dependent dioxygenase AlkB [Candidatus Protochlamydia naegleriophila]|uniref:Alpha-ketoglutarate-dependent dioxygenase AlkB n=2 Tax=Candidatus Protochlamydia naegleriophila TaxID=389348 RepID=A0A0U5JDP0_9BACT|nr:Alpha-ketoglutarate-dependent dioxygenase AlkB [Candidatus Protochlamydia naegleriophila]